MSWTHRVLLASFGASIACTAPGSADPREVDPTAPESRGAVEFHTCEDEDPPPAKGVSSFRHLGSRALALTTPWHDGEDAIAVQGERATVRAKLAYGPTSKDLEDEWVEVWIDRCGELEWLDSVLTDDDGRIALQLDAALLPGVGRHRLHFRVEGDGTLTSATLWVLPIGSRIAVFDIDGTLTTSDWELFEDLVDDVFAPILHGHAPDARAGASEITRARDEQGYVILYLTGRPYWLTQRSREWLAARGMAPGALVTTRRTSQMLPTESGVGTFKADVLAELELLGLDIDIAYGNASTDVFAYAEAGIDADATFILGRHGGEAGTVALGESYEEQLATEAFAPIAQPFER